jgi:hypothetical protein
MWPDQSQGVGQPPIAVSSTHHGIINLQVTLEVHLGGPGLPTEGDGLGDDAPRKLDRHHLRAKGQL